MHMHTQVIVVYFFFVKLVNCDLLSLLFIMKMTTFWLKMNIKGSFRVKNYFFGMPTNICTHLNNAPPPRTVVSKTRS